MKSLFAASLPVFIDGVKVVVSVFLTTERVPHKQLSVRSQLCQATVSVSHRVLESQVALKSPHWLIRASVTLRPADPLPGTLPKGACWEPGGGLGGGGKSQA